MGLRGLKITWSARAIMAVILGIPALSISEENI